MGKKVQQIDKTANKLMIIIVKYKDKLSFIFTFTLCAIFLKLLQKQ